jgi:hypothetical protein
MSEHLNVNFWAYVLGATWFVAAVVTHAVDTVLYGFLLALVWGLLVGAAHALVDRGSA